MRLSSVCFLTEPQVSVKYEGCDMVIGVAGHEPTFTCAWVRFILVKPMGPDMVQEGFEAGGLLTTQEKVTLVGVFLRTRVGFAENVVMVAGGAAVFRTWYMSAWAVLPLGPVQSTHQWMVPAWLAAGFAMTEPDTPFAQGL